MSRRSEGTIWEQFLRELHVALTHHLMQRERKVNRDFAAKTKRLLELTSTPKRQPGEVEQALQDFLGHFADNFKLPNLQYSSIQNVALTNYRLNRLYRLVKETLDSEIEWETSGNRLRAKGTLIYTSVVADYVKKHPELKAVEIFALDKVYVDGDFDLSGREIQLTIISPTWEIPYKNIINGRVAKANTEVTINLNGKDAQNYAGNAGALEPPGSPGNDGKPGKPGGNAGTFLGIGVQCSHCEAMEVLAKGGKGGRGQDGGDGRKGKDGVMPKSKISDFHCDEYHKEWKSRGQTVECDGPSTWSSRNCVVDGGGRPNGDGGNGGRAGRGGSGGSAKLLLKHQSGVDIKNGKGEDGQPGAGGRPGTEAANKRVLHITLESSYVTFMFGGGSSKCYEAQKREETVPFPDGEQGKPGAANVESAERKVEYTTSPAALVNDYKNYLRENLKMPVIGVTLQSFLNHLETDAGVTGLYDTLGLVKDLLNLENQSRKLLELNIPLAPFYQQLITRIGKYQQQLDKTQDTEENRMVLSYLYKSAQSKIQSINSKAKDNLVVDVRKNLAYVSKNIEEWQNFKNLVEKNKIRDKYKTGIQGKIEEANAFIENEISKDIETNIEKTTEQLNKLYGEVVEQEKAKEKEELALEEQRDQLRKQMALRAVLGVVQIASQALGPVGAAAGAAVGGLTSVVVDNLAGSDPTTAAVTALPAAVTNTLTKLNDAYKQKHESYKKQLTKATTKMEQFLNDKDVQKEKSEAKEKVVKIQSEMAAAKNKLEELIKNANVEDPASVDDMYNLRKKIDGLLKDGKEQVGKIGDADKYKNALEKVQNMIGLAKMGIDLYSKVQGDLGKITAVDKSIATVNEQLDKLDKFEKTIYSTMAPLIDRIRKSINSAEDSEGKSHAALDVTRWQVQGAIRDVRRELQTLTTGYKAGDEITYYVDKLEYGMSMMIQMYDRIQSYGDQGDLVDVITDVDSSTGISNAELYSAMAELKLKISDNIISEYGSSMNAVLLHVFPFASEYMKPLELPQRLNNLKGTENLIDNLRTLEKTLMREQSTIQTRDQHRTSDVTFAQDKTHPPFFEWKYSENKELIDQLLEGKTVTLTADVSKTKITENAVKFNDINIKFKAASSVEQTFHRSLAKYSLEMKHTGNSQFRCGEKFYVVNHQGQTIRRSISDEEGNEVLAKIRSNEPVISPFATWQVALKSPDSDFSSLRSFVGQQVDLTLEGHGNFVEKVDGICDDGLSRYYAPKDQTQSRFMEDEYLDGEYYEASEAPGVKYAAAVEFLAPSLPKYEQVTAESETGNAVTYSASVPANLPLFELMIRKINGSRREKRSAQSLHKDYATQFAHNLAYKAYAPVWGK